jgi:hypothetical protein
MDTAKTILVVSFVLLIISVPLYFINEYIVYAQHDYKIDIIRSHLSLALDTHNVDAKVSYIDDTVKSLEVWHGNGNWWFPTEETDIDRTRELLLSVSQDVREQEDVKDREGYFILPHNELITYLNSEIEKGDDRLHSYGKAIHFNPHNNIGYWVLLPTAFISFWTFLVFGLFRLEE